MKAVIEEIKAVAQDTEDPVEGAVFEKMVKTDAEKFDAFMKAVYEDVDSLAANDGVDVELYYGLDGDGTRRHVGSYVHAESIGYFGGSRIGSKNVWLKPGDPLLENPFEYPAPTEKANYKVRLYYNGHIDIEVNAKDELDAIQKAEEVYDKSDLSRFVRIPDSQRFEKI